MAAPISVTIDGVAITDLEESSFRIDSILGQTIDTAKMKIYDKNANIPMPEQADVVITRTDTGARIFGGLSSIPIGRAEGASRWWDLSCQDYTVLLDTNVVHNSFPSGFTYDGLSGDQAIIAHLFELDVVTLGAAWNLTDNLFEIEARTHVGQALSGMAAMYFNYVTLREAMTTIANYTGWNFHVDYNKHLHYYYREDVPAPYGLSSSPNGVTTIGYKGLTWKRDGTSIRNLFLMFGANLFSSEQTYILASNGSKTTLTLGIADIGRNVLLQPPPGESNILVDKNTGTDGTPVWTALTVGTDGFDLLTEKDCLFNATQQTLQFAVAPPNLTNSVRIRAVFILGAGQMDADNDSISKYKRTFARRLTASDANSATAMAAKLSNYKQQFSFGLETSTLKVDSTDFPGTDRFEVGQWVPLYNAVLGINKSYLIHRVSTFIRGGTLLGYELELRNWYTQTAA